MESEFVIGLVIMRYFDMYLAGEEEIEDIHTASLEFYFVLINAQSNCSSVISSAAGDPSSQAPRDDGRAVIAQKYKFCISSIPVERINLKDPSTNIEHFWPVSRKEVIAHQKLLFPNDVLRDAPLSYDEVKSITRNIPEPEAFYSFGHISDTITQKAAEALFQELSIEPTENIHDILRVRHSVLACTQYLGYIHSLRSGHITSELNEPAVLEKFNHLIATSKDSATVEYAKIMYAALVNQPINQEIAQLLVELISYRNAPFIQLEFLHVIDELSNNREHNRVVLRKVGATATLISLLSDNDPLIVCSAMEIVSCFTKDVTEKKSVLGPNDLQSLLDTIELVGKAETLIAIFYSLADLLTNELNRNVMVNAEFIDMVMSYATTVDDINIKKSALNTFYQLSLHESIRDLIHPHEGYSILVEFLSHETEMILVQKAAKILQQLTGPSCKKNEEHENDSIPVLINKLDESTDTETCVFLSETLVNLSMNENHCKTMSLPGHRRQLFSQLMFASENTQANLIYVFAKLTVSPHTENINYIGLSIKKMSYLIRLLNKTENTKSQVYTLELLCNISKLYSDMLVYLDLIASLIKLANSSTDRQVIDSIIMLLSVCSLRDNNKVRLRNEAKDFLVIQFDSQTNYHMKQSIGQILCRLSEFDAKKCDALRLQSIEQSVSVHTQRFFKQEEARTKTPLQLPALSSVNK